VTVTAFEVPHGKWEHAYGYVFKTSDRTIVVSGDTRKSEAVQRACNRCDVLVHEVFSPEQLKKRTPDWQGVSHGVSHVDVRVGRLGSEVAAEAVGALSSAWLGR
jgi:ribonuclease BN (tRNA processing enzyme)